MAVWERNQTFLPSLESKEGSGQLNPGDEYWWKESSNQNSVLPGVSSTFSSLIGPFSFLWHHCCKVRKIQQSQGDWEKGSYQFCSPNPPPQKYAGSLCEAGIACMSSPKGTTGCGDSCLEWSSRSGGSGSASRRRTLTAERRLYQGRERPGAQRPGRGAAEGEA